MILYCGPGEEVYPVYALSRTAGTEFSTPLEFTDEEAEEILKTQEAEERLHQLVVNKLEAYYHAKRP